MITAARRTQQGGELWGHRQRVVLLAAALLAAGCRLPGGHPTVPEGTPIVLVSIDTLRSDRLPAYGYRDVAAPAIDTLARDAILFERAYTHVPLTLPSHASILTGLLPPDHGVRDNLGYRLAAEEHPYLPRLLKERGYATGAAVSAFVLRAATGLAAGFDAYDDHIQVVTDAALGSLQRPGPETLAAALSWLESVRDRPFFLFFHIYEPHSPYIPPEPYRSLYRGAYDGEVAAADEVVGRLFARLKEWDLYDRSLVVLLSDHGEGLMDHGEQEHELLLYREVLQVPLLVKLPGAERGGERVARPVALTDVAPTILALLGEEPPRDLPGRSLLAANAGEAREIYAETYYPRLHFGWSELASLIRGDDHYIHGPDPELYDLATDPAERHNVLARERQTYRGLRDTLEAIVREPGAPADEDPEVRERLAALGYVGSLAAPAGGALPDPKSRLGVLAAIKSAFELYTAGDYAGAADAFRRVLAAEPGLVDAWEHLGRSLSRLGRLDEAHEAYRKAFELTGGAPQSALALAEILLRMGRLDEARSSAELALPGHDSARDLLLQIALRQHDLAEAERLLEPALAARGTRVAPLVLGASLRFEQERWREALELTDQAVREFGEREDTAVLVGVYSTRGKAHARLGESRLAEEAFLAGIRRVPQDLDCYTHLAYLYALDGRAADAGAILRRLVEANDSPDGYAAAVRTLRVMGDERSAAAVLRDARRRWPQAGELADLAG